MHLVIMSSPVPVIPVLDAHVSCSEALPVAAITVLSYDQLSIVKFRQRIKVRLTG